MSVIITGMDLPGRCDECPLALNSECPLIGIDTEEEEGSRDMNCPLKSADIAEELEKIKAEIDTLYGVYYSYFKERLVIKSDVMRILDEHISELKGKIE